MFGREIILNKVAGGGAGCTDIVDNYDPFDGNGVALYQLNGNANDVSGNYNGTASNVTYGTGVFGQAGVFNGSSSYIDTNYSLNFGDTISLWFKLNDRTQTNVFFEQYSDDVNWAAADIRADGSNNVIWILIRQASGTYYYMRSDAFSISNGEWNFITVSFVSGNNYTLTLNGASVNLTALTVSGTVTSMPSATNYLGFRREGTDYYFNGSIDQVRIFNTALTPLEVEALYTEELCICDGTVDTLQVLGDTSCIATYQLDGNANDLSGNYSGTPTDVSYGVGEFDLAGVFNGTTSYVDTGISSSLNSSFSGSMWVKPSVSQTYSAIFGSGVDSANIFVIDVRNLEVGFNVDGNLPSGTKPLLSTSSFSHICFTFDNNVIKIYVNGVEELSQTVGSISFSIDFAFGARYWSGSYNGFFNGSIDQVRIFNKALSQAEVTTLFDESACACSGTTNTLQVLGDTSCIATYNFDKAIYDLSGNYNPTSVGSSITFQNGYFERAGTFTTSINSDNRVIFPSTLFNKRTVYSVSYWTKTYSDYSTPNSFYVLGSTNDNAYDMNFSPEGLKGHGGVTSGARLIIPDFWTTYHTIGTWNHTVVVRDGSYMAVYYNGVKRAERTDAGAYYSLTNAFTKMGTGNDNNVAQKGFDGQIDQLRIFDRLITQAEVETLYNETPCN